MPTIPELNLPWLECSILLPLLGAVACGLMGRKETSQRVAVIVSALTLMCTLCEWYDFSLLGTFQAHDHWDFISWIAQEDVFVIDELSAPLLPLTALLYLLMILSTLHVKAGRFSFGMTMIAEAIVLATLSCHMPWMIIALMAVGCIPPWIELRSRGASTRVFTLHMSVFIVLLVSGWLLVDKSGGPESATLLPTAMLTMAALLRAGVIPAHLWMNDLFENASFGTAFLFVAPMTGAYAVMHLVVPIAPSWAIQSIAMLSLATAVYASAMAMVQKETRRFFCYLFLSHASLVLAGLEVVTTVGLTGALCVWLSVGISLGGFAITLRSIESRIGRVNLDQFHGMYEHTPTLAGLFLLTGLASIGFPGTIGFVGMELLVEGAVGVFPLVGLAVVVAAAFNSIAIMRAYFRIFTGRQFQTSAVLRSKPSERFSVVVMSVLLLGGGVWPQPGVVSRHHAAEELMRIRRSTQEAIEDFQENGEKKDGTAAEFPSDPFNIPAPIEVTAPAEGDIPPQP